MAAPRFTLALSGQAPNQHAQKEQLEDGINAGFAQLYSDIGAVRELAFDQARVFDTVQAGLAATDVGGTFSVRSTDPNVAQYVYRKGAGGAAELVATTPSVEALGTKANAEDLNLVNADLGLKARYGDAIQLANIAGTANEITADLPTSHVGVGVISNRVIVVRVPITNTGSVNLTLLGVSYGIRTIRGAVLAGGELRGGADYVMRIRGDQTIRVLAALTASDLSETATAKVMTAQERADLTLMRQAIAALDAAPSPYPDGYILVFDPSTRSFTARPADDLGGNMNLNFYDESAVVGTTPVELLAADADLRRVTIQNLSETASVAVAFTGGDPAIGISGITLGPGAILSDDNMPRGSVKAVASAAGVPITCYVGSKGGSPNWMKRANQLIYRHSNPGGLPSGYTAALRELYRRLDATGVLTTALYFNVLAAYDAEMAAMDWSRRAGTLSLVGTPTFTRYGGWTLDGASQHLKTERKWSDAPGITPANMAMMVWVDTTINGIGKFAISSGDSGIEANRSANGHAAKLATNGYDPVTGSSPGGMLSVQRTEAARAVFKKDNAAARDLIRTASSQLVPYEHLIGVTQSNAGPVAAGHWAGVPKFAYAGPALTDAQWASIQSACAAYLSTIGGL